MGGVREDYNGEKVWPFGGCLLLMVVASGQKTCGLP